MPAVNYNTADRIIRTALKSAGMLQEGDDPNGEQVADCMNRLNDIINLWQTQGIKLWLMATIDAPALVEGQVNYVLPTKQLKVYEAYFVDQNGVSRPLDLLSWNTYNSLAMKNAKGAVTSIFVDQGLSTTSISCWLPPDAGAALGKIQLLCRQYMANLVSLTDAMVFPNEWYMALHWALADEICTGQPQEIVVRCEKKALEYRTALEGFDVEEASVSFAPNLTYR